MSKSSSRETEEKDVNFGFYDFSFSEKRKGYFKDDEYVGEKYFRANKWLYPLITMFFLLFIQGIKLGVTGEFFGKTSFILMLILFAITTIMGWVCNTNTALKFRLFVGIPVLIVFPIIIVVSLIVLIVWISYKTGF